MGKRLYLGVLFLVAMSLPAFGSGFPDTYGIGARAISLGGAFTAVADDYAAAYYNPAGLGLQTGNHFTIDYLYTSPQIDVEKLSGGKLVTTTASGAVRNNPTEYRGGKGLDLQIPVMGLTLDVNEIVNIPRSIKFGAVISMPEKNNSMYRILSYPPDQPHFFRYGNDISRITLVLSMGAEIVPKLVYAGLGVQSMLYGDGKIRIDGVTASNAQEDKNVVAQVDQAALMENNLVAGIMITPLEQRLKIGYAYKDEQQVELDPIVNLVQMDITDTTDLGLPMVMGLVAFYCPPEHSLGVSYSFEKLMVSAEADLQQWSKYRYAPADRLKYNPANLAPAGPLVGIEKGKPDFDDTLNLRLGLEYKPLKDLSLTFGYCRQPTPIPNQSGRISNYIDMDKDIFALGARYGFVVPFVSDKPITLSGVVQYQMLDSYTVHKDGVKGYSWENQESYKVEGSALAGGLSLGLNW